MRAASVDPKNTQRTPLARVTDPGVWFWGTSGFAWKPSAGMLLASARMGQTRTNLPLDVPKKFTAASDQHSD